MGVTSRRILLISGFFPPRAPIGAVRAGKLEQHWRRLGHEVRVIAIAVNGSVGADAPIPEGVHYLPYTEPGRLLTALKSLLAPRREEAPQRAAAKTERPAQENGGPSKKPGLVDLYRQAMSFPDRYRTWIGSATQLALSWRRDWKPDLIYSSGPPHSGHLVAMRVAKRLDVPWVAELRDLWVGDPYFDRHPLLKPVHERIARRTLSQARALVAVTDEAGARLREIVRTPVIISYNGFDPEDFFGLDEVEPFDREHLTLIHAGTIYPGRRDPSPLFDAMERLGDQRRRVRCIFYHDANGAVAALAKQKGLADCVEVRAAVPRSQILKIEREVDILLECRWLDPAGDGVIPGKLFEYIGARRPILSLGSLSGEAAKIVRDNGFGLASNDPSEISEFLRKNLSVKAQSGRVPDRAGVADDRFRRETQFKKIDEVLFSLGQADRALVP